jgi:hypothetical protein
LHLFCNLQRNNEVLLKIFKKIIYIKIILIKIIDSLWLWISFIKNILYKFSFYNSKLGNTISKIVFMKKLFYIIVATLLIQSCNENSTEPKNNNLEIIPLKVGNYWIAVHTEYSPQGYVNEVDTVGMYIVKDSIWNGETIYRMSQSPDTISYDAPFFLIRSDGVYHLFLNDEERLYLYIKYPAQEGDSFLFWGDTLWVDKVNISYSTKAGTFNCIRYKTENIDDEMIIRSFHYFSPGIGAIAAEYYYQDENIDLYLESKMELIEYKIN